jgi:hypothetical protein
MRFQLEVTTMLEPIWNIARIPLVYKPLISRSNPYGIPDSLPLELSIDTVSGRLAQTPTAIVAEALDAAYRDGSQIPGIMSAEGIGKLYADDFLSMFGAHVTEDVSQLSILEIGCGTGYLLEQFHARGATVTGIEPGGQSTSTNPHIKIVRDFFPSEQVTGEFDVIIMYLLLEHMPDPTSFLSTAIGFLKKNGKLVVVVPDCETFLIKGDVSILFSEHYSYFTTKSFHNSLRVGGWQVDHLSRSKFSSLLFAVCQPSASAALTQDDAINALRCAEQYQPLASEWLSRFKSHIQSATANNKTLGLYVPGRAVNALAMANCDSAAIRFFDDSPLLHRHYFPGFDHEVESMDDLLNSPPDSVLVMSETFGERILSRIRSNLGIQFQAYTLNQLAKNTQEL